MTAEVTYTFTCDHPGCKEKFEYSKEGARKKLAKAAAKKEGWSIRSTKQLCGDHSAKAVSPKKGSGRTAKKSSGKKGASAKKLPVKRGPRVWEFGKGAEKKVEAATSSGE